VPVTTNYEKDHNMALTPDQAARAVVAAKTAKAEAEKAYKQAEAELKESFGKAGISFTVVDGEKVNLIEAARSSYDASKLEQLVSPKIFNKVTVREIDAKLLKSAVEMGIVKSEIADQVTEVKITTSVRVTAVAKTETAVADTQEAGAA
jgi:hypothetical protein